MSGIEREVVGSDFVNGEKTEDELWAARKANCNGSLGLKSLF